MTILEPHSASGWITAFICGHWVQAKVYDEPSTYGVYNGRVSKITICKTENRDPTKPFHPQLDVNYDRGTDFNNLWRKNRKLFNEIIRELEKLPKSDLPLHN